MRRWAEKWICVKDVGIRREWQKQITPERPRRGPNPCVSARGWASCTIYSGGEVACWLPFLDECGGCDTVCLTERIAFLLSSESLAICGWMSYKWLSAVCSCFIARKTPLTTEFLRRLAVFTCLMSLSIYRRAGWFRRIQNVLRETDEPAGSSYS